uniref:Bro-N domain-containing protein n=1 Tax=Ascaris lumbricoides TaxID=6252 RepID=A0A0M3HM88_ASCLU
MASFRFKFKNGEFYELFTLFFDRKDDCYKILTAKLGDFGHSANGKTLVHLEYDGKRHAIRDAASLWNVLEDFRLTSGPNYAIPIEFYEPSGVRFRLKDAEYCRRFSLKLNREDDAYKVLMNKLDQLGYKSNGRLLLCTENDGSRTVIEDCDSLWT